MGETPGPIPNPEAKTHSADGTAPGRVWESRTPPDNHSPARPRHTVSGPDPLKTPQHTSEGPTKTPAYRLFTVRGEIDPWDECHAAVRTALLKRMTDL